MQQENVQLKIKRSDEELNASVLKKIQTGETLDQEELEYKIRALQEQKEDNNIHKKVSPVVKQKPKKFQVRGWNNYQ